MLVFNVFRLFVVAVFVIVNVSPVETVPNGDQFVPKSHPLPSKPINVLVAKS
jgi:hypothetical protein